MEDDTCQICAVNKIKKEICLSCGISPCSSCMIEWIKQEATPEFIPKDDRGLPNKNEKYVKLDEEIYQDIEINDFNHNSKLNRHKTKDGEQPTIKCLNYKCMGKNFRAFNEDNLSREHKIDYYECLNYIQQISTPEQLEELADVLLNLGKFHLNKQYRCNLHVECENCYFQWEEDSLYTFRHKLKSHVLLCRGLKSYRTHLANINSAIACPKCEEVFFKSRNSDICICEYCDHCFCFNCLDEMINNTHLNNKMCPYTSIILFLLNVFCFLIATNTSLCFAFPRFANVVLPVYRVVGLVIGSNVYFFSSAFIFVLTGKAKELRNAQGFLENCMKWIYRILSYLFLPLWTGMFVCSFIFCSFCQTMGIFLAYEFGSILAGIICIALFYFFLQCCICICCCRQRNRPPNVQVQGANPQAQGAAQQLVNNNQNAQPPVNQNPEVNIESDEESSINGSINLIQDKNKEETKEYHSKKRNFDDDLQERLLK